MPIPHLYSPQKYCEPIRLLHTSTQTTTTYNICPYKHVNKHVYLFMMEPDKYRKAIAISVSAFGYNQLKKEHEDVLNFIFGNDLYLLCYQQVLVKASATLVYQGVFSSKKSHRSAKRASKESLPNS